MADEKLAEQLTKLKATMAKWTEILNSYKQWALANDGVIDASEQAQINKLQGDIDAIKARITQIETKKGINQQPPEEKGLLDSLVDGAKDLAGKVVDTVKETFDKVVDYFDGEDTTPKEEAPSNSKEETQIPVGVPQAGKIPPGFVRMKDSEVTPELSKAAVKYLNEFCAKYPAAVRDKHYGEYIFFKTVDGKEFLAHFEVHTVYGADPKKPQVPHPSIGLFKNAANDKVVEGGKTPPPANVTTITGSVGKGATNNPADVLLVKKLLNKKINAGLTEDNPTVAGKTIECIEKFQKEVVGISKPDGRIDPGGKTWNALSGGGSQPQNGGEQPNNEGGNEEPTTVTPTPPVNTASINASVGKGGTNNAEDVRVVQTLLNNHGNSLTPDGDCGAKTIAAIEKFQKEKVGLSKPDGRIDPGGKTWNALSGGGSQPQNGGEQPNNGGNQGTEEPVEETPVEQPTVKPNASLSGQVGQGKANAPGDVAAIQTLLNKFGNAFKVDGVFTPALGAAIEKFQKDEVGLSKPDGVVDPGGKTWNTLNGQKPGAPPAGPMNKPNWIKIAESEIGQKEIVGAKHNPRIIEYHATTGNFKDDETAWCSSFVNWVMNKAGQGGTNSGVAISWAKWGKKVAEPAYGAIAVIDWDGPGPGWKGHVGFVVGKKGNSILLLGGNQSNAVNVASFGTSKVIAYVYPSNFEIPANFYTFGEAEGDFGDDTDMSNTR